MLSFDQRKRSNLQPDSFKPVFRIRLRDDDKAILLFLQSNLAIGRIHLRIRESSSNPQVDWEVKSIGDCLFLVRLFDRFPLRAKKSRDFQIWREAVLEKATGLGHYSNARLEGLKAQLERTREYQGSESLEQIRLKEPDQLRLIS